MKTNNPDPLAIAVRVYPSPKIKEKGDRKPSAGKRPNAMFVFDTETRVDATQRLTFGSYRFFLAGHCMEEGIFYSEDLSPDERGLIEKYVSSHYTDAGNAHARLKLFTRAEFLERLYKAAYKGRCLIVGFNLPFDLSRVATDAVSARGRFAGGFSLGMGSYVDETGRERPDRHRPRVGIKHIDSKRALKGFTSRRNPDAIDLIPEGSETGEPEPGYKFRGHFLDLRTLAFALTDRGYSLETACEAFGVEHGKQHAARHGIVSNEYIDYNRRDVLATYELAVKVLEEYDRHPISLQATKAYSPASIGKAYLRAMGIVPILQRQPDFPQRILGYAQSAFFGGRAGAHVRKWAVPVVYTDFLSMYPTVNSLMGLWRFVIAQEIRVVDDCQGGIEGFLKALTPDLLFQPATWAHLTAFVRIIPDGDVLPTRGKYSAESNDWQVGVNHLHGDGDNSRHGLWFSLPDVAASVILTGRVPRIIETFRIEPVGVLADLKSTRLRGTIDIDPLERDFFRVAIEERKRLASRRDLVDGDKSRLDKALKVLANAASYGIYAEMNRVESDDPVQVTCHGIDSEPFACRVTHPEEPGEYCFPPLASLITGAARLMLALLERSVADLGGTHAMEDTDSMAIVATRNGGLVLCPGGPRRTPDGRVAVQALSWQQVEEIAKRFAALNPYEQDAVPGSVLKIEDDNFDPKTEKQRELYCFAISAKRYALFLEDRNGRPVLLRKSANNKEDRWSEHGLGHLLNPTDPESEDRDWIGQIWLGIIRRALCVPTEELAFADAPAVGRVTVSSPAVMRAFMDFNVEKRYADQIKPFNFLLTCQVKPFGHPTGADPARFHLISPYEPDPRKWLSGQWLDQYTGTRYRITTDDHQGSRKRARVKTYGEILTEYEFHPESKCADGVGNVSDRQTIGLLQRRHVCIDQIRYIGKESNSLEDVESGMVHSVDAVYTEYPDARRDEWQTVFLPVLKRTGLADLIAKAGLSRRALMDLRAGRSRPHPKNREKLISILRELP